MRFVWVRPAMGSRQQRRSKLEQRIANLVTGKAVLLILSLLIPMTGRAQGGPPLITDDPDTPGPGFWEINLSAITEKSHRERRVEGPLADINYGVGHRIQLKFEIPWVSQSETGKQLQSRIGNSLIGVKWRFVGGEKQKIAWATYPQLEINTSRSMARRGIVDEGWQFLFPTELTVQIRRLELNGEVGRNFAEKGDNGWIFGISTEVELPREFELLGELHATRTGPILDEFIFNIGTRKQLTPQISLLFSAGRTLHNTSAELPFSRLYIGLQFNLPHRNEIFQSVVRP